MRRRNDAPMTMTRTAQLLAYTAVAVGAIALGAASERRKG